VTSAISGFTHAWETSATAGHELDEIVHRLDAVSAASVRRDLMVAAMRQRPAPRYGC
jgi:hypothetical protein